jgi:hypothetical protein
METNIMLNIEDKDWLECVGGGWHPLVKPLLAYCREHKIEIHQVKEKFGGLRFYYYANPDIVSTDIWKTIRDLVDAAELLSNYTCETCGEPGKPTTDGWIKTVCTKHINEQKQYLENQAKHLKAFQI